MGKPAVPMYSGIAEMVIRIGVIVSGLPVFGFAAAVYAEGAAWIGALLLNLFSYLHSPASCLRDYKEKSDRKGRKK